MKFWVGVTDSQWFEFLSKQNLDEVNFWQPSSKPLFISDDLTGMPFLFKLKKPNNHIAGGGFYVGYSQLSLEMAWDVFGIKNGASSCHDFLHSIDPKGRIRNSNDTIGCTILANPFFLDRNVWLDNPPNWAGNIVRGKSYYTDNEDGAYIWDHCSKYIFEKNERESNDIFKVDYSTPESLEKYGLERMVRSRLGQGSFRMMLIKAYNGKCAFTGENTLEVLEAAHIVPYSKSGTHDVKNGLLLRADFHRLFDKGLISVTSDFEIRISPRIRECYFNGKAYYRLDGKKLTVIPENDNFKPDRDFLDYHFKNFFQG